MSEQKIPIPAMLYNAAVGGHVTNSQQVIDETLNREQSDINQEVLFGEQYNSTTPNGMGRIVLKKNDNFKTVVEAQTSGNTIFVIKYDFTLTDNVTVPTNCILQFKGGKLTSSGAAIVLSSNCSIIGQNKNELNNISVNMRGTNIHIYNIDSESSIYSPAFQHSTIHNSPNDFSNIIIENCRITANGISGENEAASGSAIHFGSDYEEGLVVKNIIIRNNVIFHRSMGVEFCNHYHPDASDPYGQNTDTLRLKDITIENNYIKCIVPETQYGFNISLSGRISNIRVSDNTLVDGKQCIEVVSHINKLDVLNNTFIQETDVARWYFFDWAATLNEYGQDYNLIGNTFKGTQRNSLYFQYIKNLKVSDNHFFASTIQFNNTEDVEFTNNYCDLKHGYNVLIFAGAVRTNICYNTILQDSNAYLFDFLERENINPSDNIFAHNFYKKGGDTYPIWRSNNFSTTNFVYDNTNIATGNKWKEEGTTAEKPDRYLNIGYKYFNTDNKELEIWDGTNWIGRFVVVKGAAPLTIPVINGGMLYIKDASGSSVSVFPCKYYEPFTATEITQNGRFVVKRDSNAGNIEISRVDTSITANITATFMKIDI